ncbi:hypothetical protein SAMN04489812_0310 [Microlunatus soli]|uniref:Uncharacterized protein n=2 Tax=Microlunatus soli TaxID=630515 RepID=A0A1H1MZ41_9ACTN|nr:hypothetical protein SAMN04489812_0310 [Microlunatus soli]
MLRWSAELVISEGRSARLGIVVLESLADSELLQPEDQPIVNGVLIAVTRPPVDEIVGGLSS